MANRVSECDTTSAPRRGGSIECVIYEETGRKVSLKKGNVGAKRGKQCQSIGEGISVQISLVFGLRATRKVFAACRNVLDVEEGRFQALVLCSDSRYEHC